MAIYTCAAAPLKVARLRITLALGTPQGLFLPAFSMPLGVLWWFIFTGFLISQINGGLVTRYIDDTYGDIVSGESPIYNGTWVAASYCGDGNCRTGSLKPDSTRIRNGTWHDSTYHQDDLLAPGFTFSFVGISFTIYCIIPNSDTFSNGQANISLTFTLDDSPAGSFEHTSDRSNAFTYSAPVLFMQNLTNERHTVQAVISRMNSLALFDYVEYIFDDGKHDASGGSSTTLETSQSMSLPTQFSEQSATTDGKKNQLAIILGPVFGGLAAILFVVVGIFAFRRRQKAQVQAQASVQYYGIDDDALVIATGTTSPVMASTGMSRSSVHSQAASLPPPYSVDHLRK